MLCPPGDNGIAKYLPAGLAQTPRGFEHPALFDLPNDIQQLGRINFCNRSEANLWKYIAFQPRQDLCAIPRGESLPLGVKPFPRDDLKRALIRVQGCTFFGLLCRVRISTLLQQYASVFGPRPCTCQRGCWINPQRESAALSSKTVVQSPVTCAIRPDEKVHAATIAELVCLGSRLSVTDVRVGQRHDGISQVPSERGPPQCTVIDTDNFSGCKRQPARTHECPRWIYAAASMVCRTWADDREQLRTRMWLGD